MGRLFPGRAEGASATEGAHHGAAKKPTVGVLGLQGAVSEHIQALEKSGANALPVRHPDQLDGLAGLVLPGGESTTIGMLSRKFGFLEKIQSLAADGTPLLGTCAGMVMLAKEVQGQTPILSCLSIQVRRNAFGRQRESFEADLAIPVLGIERFRCVFIRAPLVLSCGEDVRVLARWEGQPVAVQEGVLLATSFHPELTEDLRLHRYFFSLVEQDALKKAGYCRWE